ncbi:MAG: hypothetical protein JWN56_2505 [Sphingobacteriales bacterium]|nr:hypothetical protein [Sphingobacteriales bacterium]
MKEHVVNESVITPSAISNQNQQWPNNVSETQTASQVPIQTKLTVGSPDDPLEHEADSVADQIVRAPENSFIQRKCDECEKEEKLQKKSNGYSQSAVSESTSATIQSAAGKGSTLDQQTNSFMSSHFGNDFSGVKIHTDPEAIQLNRDLNAKAFTTGADIYFNEGQYQPHATEGKKLLAHELTHVVQQKAVNRNTVQRQLASDPKVDYVDQRDGAPHATTCGGPSSCPATFCQPYTSENFARSQRDKMMWILLGGIAAFVDSRVVPLWSEYLMGGSPPQNLTSKFGADFAASPTTATTTSFLVNALKRNLGATRPSFPTGVNVTVVDLKSIISAEIAAINKAGGANEMDFNFPSDIAGNLAGGIGDNQTACKSGAQPSPFNDERLASGIATVIRDSSDNLTVFPLINYTVKDTIDLCPGNCGTSKEQIATVPMSQFEATGISGDVPFTIDFSSVQPPFIINHV